MILYFLRFCLRALVGALGPRHSALEVRHASFRAWPWVCDAYRHMNNAMYAIHLDHARVDWVAGAGLLRLMLQRRWTAVVAGKQEIFKRPVPLMSRFTVETRVLGWDARWVYLSQQIRDAKERPAYRAIVRWALRDSRGAPVELGVALELLGDVAAPPELSAELLRFIESQDSLLDELTQEAG